MSLSKSQAATVDVLLSALLAHTAAAIKAGQLLSAIHTEGREISPAELQGLRTADYEAAADRLAAIEEARLGPREG